jgi:hypothetical protein
MRDVFCRAPLRFVLAIALLYGSAILLFLWSAHLKMMVQSHRDILDLTLISLATTFPGHIAVGWAWSRAARRPSAPRGWPAAIWRWTMRILLAAALVGYVYLLSLTPLTGELGRHFFDQHHPLLLPVPW